MNDDPLRNGNGAKRKHASSVAAAAGPVADFIPASTWQGSRPGYYFGTSGQGTGYYRDLHQQPPSQEQDGQPPPESSAKKKKRSVMIAEDRNETRTIPRSSAEVLLEEAEQESANTKVMELTPKGVRTAATGLGKAVEKNQLQRARHADEPDQYMESEVTLYENISSLKAIAADPLRLYPAVLETDLPLQLTQLLTHENSDIVASVTLVFLEWLDPSLLEQQDDEDIRTSLVQLAEVLIRDGVEMLVVNLARLQSSDDDEVGKGTEDVLSLLENLLELDNILVTSSLSVAKTLVQETQLVSWLLEQVERNEPPLSDRSLELLALLTAREEVFSVLPNWSQLPPYSSVFLEDDKKMAGAKSDDDGESEKKDEASANVVDGIEILLQKVGAYRKEQPSSDQEIESLENACDVLASVITYSPTNAKVFLDSQGIELAVRCLKQRVHAGGVALKWLEFSGAEAVHTKACEHVVEVGALKYIFPLFLGRNLPKMAPTPSNATKKAKKEWQQTIVDTSIRILYSLTWHLNDDSPNDVKQRLLTKFVSDDAKCDRLVELCLAYDQKARAAEYKFFRSDVEETLQDDEAVQLAALEAKLAGGGDIFHRLGALAAFCCIGSKSCHERILSQLHLQQSGIGLIRHALEEFISVLGDSEQRRKLEEYLQKI